MAKNKRRDRRRHYTKTPGVQYGRPKKPPIEESHSGHKLSPEEMSFTVRFQAPEAFEEARVFFGGRRVIWACDFVRLVHKKGLKPLY